MSEITGKRRNIYVDHPKIRSKITCLIHGPGNSSDDCQVFGEFVNKYDKYRPNKDCSHYPATRKCFGRQQETNSVTQHTVDEIILQKNEKLSVKYETHDNIDDEVDEDELYELDKMSLDEKKLRNLAFERKLKYIYDIKYQIVSIL